jgi:hypothetical protein
LINNIIGYKYLSPKGNPVELAVLNFGLTSTLFDFLGAAGTPE